MTRTYCLPVFLFLSLFFLSSSASAAIVPGDINGDAAVDSLDVILLANFLAGNIDPTAKQNDQYGLGDIDADGRLKEADLGGVQIFYAGSSSVTSLENKLRLI